MKREVEFWLCVVLWVALGLLLASCTSLAPKPTDDEFYYLSKEQSSIVYEGPCEVSLNGVEALAYCYTHESRNEKDMNGNPVVYISVHNLVTRERVLVFVVGGSGQLTPVWRKQYERNSTGAPRSQAEVRSL